MPYIVCVFLETNITEKKNERAEEKNLNHVMVNMVKYDSCYSDIRGSISFISLRIYVLVRFATFSAFFCISWLYIIYIYMYILLYILIAYNFNLYTYMIFIILDLSSLYFSYCKHGSLSLSDYLINIILGKEIRLLNNSIAMLCDPICNIVCCSIIYHIAMIQVYIIFSKKYILKWCILKKMSSNIFATHGLFFRSYIISTCVMIWFIFQTIFMFFWYFIE